MFDCGSADIIRPDNGTVVLNQTTLGSVATFACNAGFALIGDATRTCELTGWSGSNPSCGTYVSIQTIHLQAIPVIIPINL